MSRIRIATLEDLETVLQHRHAMFREMQFPEAKLEAMNRETRPYFTQAFQDGRYHHWFVESGDRIVAGAGLSVSPFYPGPRDPRPERAWILNVYTEPDFRKQGFARQLVETAIEWCRTNGFATVYLHASEFGRSLYENLGFVTSPEMRLDFYR